MAYQGYFDTAEYKADMRAIYPKLYAAAFASDEGMRLVIKSKIENMLADLAKYKVHIPEGSDSQLLKDETVKYFNNVLMDQEIFEVAVKTEQGLMLKKGLARLTPLDYKAEVKAIQSWLLPLIDQYFK